MIYCGEKGKKSGFVQLTDSAEECGTGSLFGVALWGIRGHNCAVTLAERGGKLELLPSNATDDPDEFAQKCWLLCTLCGKEFIVLSLRH